MNMSVDVFLLKMVTIKIYVCIKVREWEREREREVKSESAPFADISLTFPPFSHLFFSLLP